MITPDGSRDVSLSCVREDREASRTGQFLISEASPCGLSNAANDRRGARIDLDADPRLIEDALFYCQALVLRL
jgi:hypothetical protein